MFFEYIWALALVNVANLAILIVILAKMHKQERFQTSEAHANLELINQSLNRLSEIAEKLERTESPINEVRSPISNVERERNDGRSKEQKAISMIRQGEDPRKISRKLGISKSEIELLLASEKLGKSRFSNTAEAHV